MPNANINCIQSPMLAGQGDAIAHGFTGRSGGVSQGIVAGLNVGLGSDDDRAAVLENRARATAAILPGADLLTLHQVHSADVLHVTEPFAMEARPKADGMVTDRPGLLLGVLGADCAPVLFADSAAGVVGACHAGWRGALSGVTDATLTAMEALGAQRGRIVTAIGPCIAQRSYEVDDGFLQSFCASDPANERFFIEGRVIAEPSALQSAASATARRPVRPPPRRREPQGEPPREQRFQFDLEGYIAARLAGAGVTRVDCLGEDTYSQPDRFFSYRRATHLGEADYGRQMGCIGLRE